MPQNMPLFIIFLEIIRQLSQLLLIYYIITKTLSMGMEFGAAFYQLVHIKVSFDKTSKPCSSVHMYCLAAVHFPRGMSVL